MASYSPPISQYRGQWVRYNLDLLNGSGVRVSSTQYFYYANQDGLTVDSSAYDSGNRTYDALIDLTYAGKVFKNTKMWLQIPLSYTPLYEYNAGYPYGGTTNTAAPVHYGGTEIFATITTYRINSLNKDFSARIIVPTKNFAIESGLKVDIPFPYKEFTDTVFFVTDQYGRFISERYYTRINNKQIQFVANAPLGIISGNDVRFVFCHNHNKYSVQKLEINIKAIKGQYSYKINPPYSDIVNLDSRTRVFINRTAVYSEFGDYVYTDQTNTLHINKNYNLKGGEDIDVLIFHTGHHSVHGISTLPQSGYIYLDKMYLDRNYNKKLMNIFLNGKLVDEDVVMDMTNHIHKISKDINTTHDLHVLGMSPKVPSLTSFHKNSYYRTLFNKPIENKPISYDFFGKIEVAGEYTPHNRHCITEDCYPTFPLDILEKYKDYYISLIHASTEGISYNLKFYKNDFAESPSPVNVVAMLAYKALDTETYTDSYTMLLMGKLDKEYIHIGTDLSLYSVQINKIISGDTWNKSFGSLKSIMCKLEIERAKIYERNEVYYELVSSSYQEYNYVNAFEWRISTKPNGNGDILYKEYIRFLPSNIAEIEEEEEED